MSREKIAGDSKETSGQPDTVSRGAPSVNLSAPSREKGFALATFLVIIGLILSKSTGFIREMLIASKFPEEIRESWRLSFLIPDLVYQLLVGGAIQAAITPSLARSIRLGEEKKGFRSVSIFISIAAVIMGGMVIAGILLAEFVYPLIWSDPGKSEIVRIASNAARILFPQIFFMMLAAFSIGILNAYKKFTATAMGPTVYNVFVLLAIIIWGGPSDRALYRVVIGIMAAALIYFLFQVAVGKKYLKHFRFSLDHKDEGFRSLFFLAIPILISSSIIQLNTIVISHFADVFTNLQFSIGAAEKLWQMPYGIFAVGVGSVMLPSLAGHFAAGKLKSASELLSSSLRNALFMTIPMSGLLIMMPSDIITAVFRWSSNFSEGQVKNTSILLLGYSAAVIIQTVIFIYNQAYYAIGKTKMPLFSGCISLLVVFFSNYVLISLNPDPKPIYLTLSYSLAGIMSALFLVLNYRRNKELVPKGILSFVLKASVCLAALVAALYFVNMIRYQPDGKIMEFLYVAIKAVIGLLVYIACAALLKMPELRSFLERVSERFTKKKSRRAS